MAPEEAGYAAQLAEWFATRGIREDAAIGIMVQTIILLMGKLAVKQLKDGGGDG